MLREFILENAVFILREATNVSKIFTLKLIRIHLILFLRQMMQIFMQISLLVFRKNIKFHENSQFICQTKSES